MCLDTWALVCTAGFSFYRVTIAWLCLATAEHVDEVDCKMNPKWQMVIWSEMQTASYSKCTLLPNCLEMSLAFRHLGWNVSLVFNSTANTCVGKLIWNILSIVGGRRGDKPVISNVRAGSDEGQNFGAEFVLWKGSLAVLSSFVVKGLSAI